jgi:hypothetical protein
MATRVFSTQFYSSIDFVSDHLSSDQKAYKAVVDSNRTFTSQEIAPKGYLDRVKNFFTFTQDGDLPAVHEKLSALMEQVKECKGELFERCKDEIHENGYRGFYGLTCNLVHLNSIFVNSNETSRLARFALAIVNVFRKVFGYDPIALQAYKELDLDLFRETMQKTALQMTDADRQKARHDVMVLRGQKPEDLTTENVQKLECDLLEGPIAIFSGNQRFLLLHDKKDQTFGLRFVGCREELDWEAMLETEDCEATGFTEVNMPAKIEESDPAHPNTKKVVELSVTVKVTKSGWFSDKITYWRKPSGWVPLTPGFEYTLLPSDDTQKPVVIKLTKKD